MEKTLGQKRYIQALKSHELVFGVGPAGTGKTYLAVAGRLLGTTELSVTEIARDCGFNYASYFSKIFLRNFGTSPREYRIRERA